MPPPRAVNIMLGRSGRDAPADERSPRRVDTKERALGDSEQAATSADLSAGARSSAPPRATDVELAVLVLADGVRPDVLTALSDAGELPNITRHVLAEGSYLDGVTVLPSVTDVAYLPMLTVQYPGTANIPGIRWVDKSRFKSGRLFVTAARSYVGAAHLRFNGDLHPGLETLFELCPSSFAVRSDIHRGLSHGRNRFHHLSIPFMFFSHYLKRADFIDRLAMGSLMRATQRMRDDLPRFVFVPLLDVDTASHAYGPHHRRTIAAYRRLDAAIGAIIQRLRTLGVWRRTHLLVSSDHGHTATHEHLNLRRLVSELGYSVLEHPNVYRRWADAAVMISGNSFANIYLASEGKWDGPLTGQTLWREHPRLLDALSRRVEVEWPAYRSDAGLIEIASASGRARVGRENGWYAYHYDGEDPLRLGLAHTRVPASAALQVTAETGFPDALEQMWHLFESRRAGDIVVTSKPGYDLRGRREIPEHHSSHGALCRDHMRVPILSNRPLRNEGPVRTVDLFPTVASSLGLAPTKPHFGRSLWP